MAVRVRSVPTLFLIATLLALTFAPARGVAAGRKHPTIAAERAVTVTLDGVSLGKIGRRLTASVEVVALAPLASAVGWKMLRLNRGARLSNRDAVLVLRIDSRTIEEDGEPVDVLRYPLVDLHGALYVDADDAAHLFTLHLARGAEELAFHRPVDLASQTTIEDVAKPKVPRPRPTPASLRVIAEAQAAELNTAGRVTLAVVHTGSTNLFELDSHTNGAYLNSYVNASGVDGFGTPTEAVTIGGAEHNIGVGALESPLRGIVFRSGVYDGVSLVDGYRSAFVGRLINANVSLAGYSFGDPLAGGTNTIAVGSSGGAFDEVLLRHYTMQRTPWGQTGQELIAGDRGAAVAYSAQTSGRLFLESELSYAVGSLPLVDGDAPVRINGGYRMSDATTIVAGSEEDRGQPFSPYAAITTVSGNLVGSLSATMQEVTAALAYRTSAVNIQAYTAPGPQRDTGLQGTFILPSALVKVDADSSQDANDQDFEVQSVRRGINAVLGYGTSSGAAGPIYGVTIPAGPLLELEATMRPSSGSRSAFRLAMSVAIPRRAPKRPPTVAAMIHVVGVPPGDTLRLFVDGIPEQRFTGDTVQAQLTRGDHTVSVESLDGKRGSQASPIDVESAGDAATLALWPMRAASGRVALADPALAGRNSSLAGISLLIEPGAISTVTDDDGTFVFPEQPMPPGARITVDEGTLPQRLRAPQPVAFDGQPVTIVLKAAKVEEQKFP